MSSFSLIDDITKKVLTFIKNVFMRDSILEVTTYVKDSFTFSSAIIY